MAVLSGRERRLLVLTGLLVVGVGAYLLVIEPMRERGERVQALIAARERLLTKQQGLLARGAAYAAERETLEAELGRLRQGLLPADKPAVAASTLQQQVKGMAEQSGVEIRSEKILPPVARGAYLEIPLELTMASPIRPLTRFLHRLEGTPALLTVSDLKLRVLSVGQPRELLTTLTLSGYIRGEGSGAGDAAPMRKPEPARRGPGT